MAKSDRKNDFTENFETNRSFMHSLIEVTCVRCAVTLGCSRPTVPLP